MEATNRFKGKDLTLFRYLLNINAIAIALVTILRWPIHIITNIERITGITSNITGKRYLCNRLRLNRHRITIERINLQDIPVWVGELRAENILFATFKHNNCSIR